MNLNKIVELEHISRRFDTFIALKNITFTISEGETMVLLGPNGAGKSTLLRIIMGFLKPSEGTVKVFGKPIDRLASRERRRMAYIPDVTHLWSELNAWHHLELFGSLAENPVGREQFERILELVRLPHEAWSRRVGTYSHGMLRKLTIACALVHEPQLILMDEPTLGLDPVSLQDFIAIMESLKEQKVTILMTSHDLFIVEYLADRAVLLVDGRIQATWTRKQLAQINLRSLYLNLLKFPDTGVVEHD